MQLAALGQGIIIQLMDHKELAGALLVMVWVEIHTMLILVAQVQLVELLLLGVLIYNEKLRFSKWKYCIKYSLC